MTVESVRIEDGWTLPDGSKAYANDPRTPYDGGPRQSTATQPQGRIPAPPSTNYKQVCSVDFKEDYTHRGPTGVFGYPEGRTDVPGDYMIQIKSTSMSRTIRALLQEPFYTSVESTWRNPSYGSHISGEMQEISQALSGLSLGSQFMTRRVWYGSTPMNLQLKMKFEAIADAYKEVVIPCGTLQQMALPSKLHEKTESGQINLAAYFLIVPPGPNPYNGELREMLGDSLPGALGRSVKTRTGDIITIDIGNFISFKSVIVSKAEVVWGKKFTKEGYPISATASISFQSFEMYTKEDVYSEFMSKRLEKPAMRDAIDKWRTQEQDALINTDNLPATATPPINPNFA